MRATADGSVQIASVFVPVGSAGQLLAQLSAYETHLTKKGNRQQAGFVEPRGRFHSGHLVEAQLIESPLKIGIDGR